jgi:hypothetical protein
LVLGQFVAVAVANVAFFTSAQHRVPMAVPLAFAAGPVLQAGLDRLRPMARCPSWIGPLRWNAMLLAMLLVVQGFWPRSRRSSPSPVHYYNLAMAHHSLGHRSQAMQSIDRALAMRPTQPLFLLERARLRMAVGDAAGAAGDLNRIRAAGSLPAWVEREVEALSRTVRRDSAPPAPD